MRSVDDRIMDKIIADDLLLAQLTSLTSALRVALPFIGGHLRIEPATALKIANEVMEKILGYYVARSPSAVGGTGVIVKRSVQGQAGTIAVQRGQLVGLYPGTTYLPIQPIFFQSVANPFIFRCADGVLIDGNDKRLSKSLYRSCVNRDRVGLFPIADVTWLTPYPLNPLNVGQYVNNQSRGHPSNVAYQELTLHPNQMTLQERQFIPNLWYSPPEGFPVFEIPVRLVALVATKDIKSGEELFSDYFTIIR